MTDAQPSTLTRIAAGAAVGLVAGLVASFAMDRFQALTQPSADQQGEPATQQAADKIARDVTGSPLSNNAKPIGGLLVHYGLGAALGIGYGVAAELAPQVTACAGTAFAAATWAVLDEATVPAIGLGDAPCKAPLSSQTYSFVSHMVFGIVAETTRRIARWTIAPASEKA